VKLAIKAGLVFIFRFGWNINYDAIIPIISLGITQYDKLKNKTNNFD